MKTKMILIFFALLFIFHANQSMSQTIGWEKLSFESPFPLYGIYCLNYDTVIAVGDFGYILRTTDGGSSWNTIPSNTTNTLYKVHFVNHNIGYIVGENGTVLKTNDMGQNWTNIGLTTNMNFFSLSFISVDTGWISGGEGDLYQTTGNKGILLKTTNGGISWIVDSTYNATIASVFFIDNDTGYITMNLDTSIGDIASLKKTTNGGSSFFTKKQDTVFPIGFYTDIHFIDEKTGFFVNSSASAVNYGVLKSIDYGNTWSKVADQRSIKALDVIDSCSFYYSWSDMPGDGSIGKNTCSLDSFIGPSHRIFDFSFINIDSGYAVGNIGCYIGCNGVIYKRVLLANINENETQKISIYPNPASDIINFVLPDYDDYEIVVYDALSSIVILNPTEGRTIEDGKCSINISHLPPGIYFIEARGDKILRGRFVKE